MNFEYSDKTKQLVGRVRAFMDKHIYPNTERFEREVEEGPRWKTIPVVEELKVIAKREGLWNMFMPPNHGAEPVSEFPFEGMQLTNLEYAPVAELMGAVHWSSEVFNCSAPDTGNMEVLMRYGTREQQERWLRPLMNGEIRSAFLMTEPGVASSDATNIETEIRREGDEYVINGHKWWSSGVAGPNCKLLVVMGKTDKSAPKHLQQSQILVPRDAPGVKVVRTLKVFGFDDAPHGHGEVILKDVRVPVSNMILGEGRGFEIAQGRLGPGRIHHCMRAVGRAETALEKMTRRLLSREAFGKILAEHSVWEQRVAEARINIEMTRLLCLKAAYMMDNVGNKFARNEIAMIKVAAPRTALKIIDDAIQAHGGGGLSNRDFGLAELYAGARVLRIADGPDEVHNRTVARGEYAKYKVTGARKASA